MSQDNVTHLNRDVRFESRPAGFRSGGNPDTRMQFNPGREPHKKFVAKGHDAQLMDAQVNRLIVTLTTISGLSITGIITKRDKYTITIQHVSGTFVDQPEIFYKHAIESVLITQSANS